MDTNDWVKNLQPAAGSKRPSSSPDAGYREVKLPRRLSREENADDNNLDDELPLPIYGLSQQSVYYSYSNQYNEVPLPFYDLSQQSVYYSYSNQYNHGAGNQFDNFTPSEAVNASPELMAMPHQILTDYFYRPLTQTDVSMENSFFSANKTSTRSFEEMPSLEKFNSLGELQEGISEGHTAAAPSIPHRVDASQHDQPEFNKFQISDMLPQTPGETALDESIDVCSNYDTCFGVIVAVPTSSYAQNEKAHSAPVKLRLLGSMFLLYDQNSDLHLGTLYNPRLIGALCELPLRLDATLFISEVKHIKEKRRPQMRKYVSTEATRGYSIRIVLHGLRIDKDTVGDLLSDAGFFLQHPYAAEVIPGIQYDNPHYLVRPGTGMPKLEQLHLHGMNESITQTEVRDEIAKSYFIRIFETAEADGDAVTVINTSLSPRLRSTLMRHQVLALAMMQEKESGFLEEPMFPSLWRRESSKNSKNSYYRHDITRLLEHRPIPAMGGILADDMGLGKSLSMLALICSSLDFNSMTIHRNQNERHQGTLIVAPKSTIYGWVAQIKEHIHEGQLRVIIYHGSDRQSLADQFRDVDVVITTYQTIRTEWAAKGATNPLFSWKWLRVVLDEGKVQYVMGLLQLIDLAAAHHIRNRSQQAFQSVCDLVSQYRWCLTGTPIHNSLDDYGALLSFIRVFPFIQKSKFVCWIVKPVEEKHSLGVERLQRLIRATCLRRMKEKILSSNDLKLPLRSEMIHEIYLHQDDKDLYDAIKKLCAETAAGLDERPEAGLLPKGKGKNILLLINSLRLICNHGERLLPDKMKRLREENSVSCFESGMKQVYSARCSVCDGEIDDDVTRTEDQDPICFNCVDSEVDSHIIGMKGDLLGKRSISDYRPSAKVLALLENLKGEQTAARYNHKSRKSVVFSVWVKMLDLVAQALHQEGFVFQRIDGQTSLEGRRKAMQEFEANPDCTVLLASIGSCAEGVNITAACIVHLLEPHWNPMVETQAIDRVYRIGQTQDVTVIRYIVPNSVETYIQEVQQEKKQLIDRAINIDGVTGGDVESKRWQRMKEILAEVPG